MKKKLTGLVLVAGILGACQTKNPDTPLAVTYRLDDNRKGDLIENKFIIYNESNKPVEKNWTIYYSQMPRSIKQDEGVAAQVVDVNANYFKIEPTADYQAIAPGDSLVVTFYTNLGVNNISNLPEGMYAIFNNQHDKPLPIDLKIECNAYTKRNNTVFDATKVFRNNAVLSTETVQRTAVDVLPSVKSAHLGTGTLELGTAVDIKCEDGLESEAELLSEKLAAIYQIQTAENSPVKIHLSLLKDNKGIDNEELYELQISDNGVAIAGSTAHGVFNGTQTLLSLLKDKTEPYALEQLTILDYPDLHYRGMMLDIARNYTTIDNIHSLIDVLSTYKINKLHLHLTDDEGWRLEIPGLEELTTVGSKRGHTIDESTHLYPAYDGNYDATANTSGNGFYTRAEFIELLQFAKARHIQIIPEIDIPGHSRAAIKAMNARYHKYMDTDPEKANEYLLADFEDESEYFTAQWYNDNVINVALPSTYRFIDKVFGELVEMYKEAGAQIDAIHIGGDEVPNGAWMKSPRCLELMKETGMKSTKDLQEYFFTKANDILHKYNLKVSGWQEMAMHNPKETDEILSKNTGAIYCWNTGPYWGGDVIPYTVANKGYPTVLCNVNNLYIDLAYSPHPEERGLVWGGYVDEAKTFSVVPFSIYKSLRLDFQDNPIDLEKVSKDKLQLKEEAKDHILGMQVQLFSETIRDFDAVEYFVFPKMLGLVERAWNAHPAWEHLTGAEEQKVYNEDLSLFYAKLSDLELPYLESLGVNFRLPHPGIEVKEGLVYLNTPLRHASIRYTLDGTEPTASSPLWTEAVAVQAGQEVKAKLFFGSKESLTSFFTVK